MTDSALMRLANQAGIEDSIVRDGEGGLANRYGLALMLLQSEMLTNAEYTDILMESETIRDLAENRARAESGNSYSGNRNYDGLD